MEMNIKNLVVSFFVIASVLLLVATVNAAEITTNYSVKVDGVDVGANDISVVAGELVTVKVTFVSEVDDVDVTMKAEIEGDKENTEANSAVFDVEAGKVYSLSIVQA